MVGLIDRGRLAAVSDRVAGDELVERHTLATAGLRGRKNRECVRGDGTVDRQHHVGIAGHGEVDRRRQIQCEVDVDVEVEERDGQNLLGRKNCSAFGMQILDRETFES